MKKLIGLISVMMSAVIMLCSCGSSNTNNSAATIAPAATVDPEKLVNTVPIEIEFTSGDVIKADLYPDIAPITVANFEKLVNEHFYDGLIFHRVINGFMIQGGGYTPDLTEKSADSIKGEFSDNGFENNLSHKRGVLSMARTQVKDSASSQFFIVQKDSTYLDGQYAAFGMVTEGMDVVDKIAAVQTGVQGNMQDVPVEPVVIQSITIDE